MRVELYFAHGLRQGPSTLSTSSFGVHQDTEEFPFIEHTVVVKLTADAPGEPPSQMRVLGAAHPFAYGAEAGAAGSFQARLHHASIPPKSDREHFKVAFFYRIAADVRPTAAVSHASTVATATATAPAAAAAAAAATSPIVPASHTTTNATSSPKTVTPTSSSCAAHTKPARASPATHTRTVATAKRTVATSRATTASRATSAAVSGRPAAASRPAAQSRQAAAASRAAPTPSIPAASRPTEASSATAAISSRRGLWLPPASLCECGAKLKCSIVECGENDTISCDGRCGYKIGRNEQCWSCEACDFDLCLQCLLHAKGSKKRAASVLVWCAPAQLSIACAYAPASRFAPCHHTLMFPLFADEE